MVATVFGTVVVCTFVLLAPAVGEPPLQKVLQPLPDEVLDSQECGSASFVDTCPLPGAHGFVTGTSPYSGNRVNFVGICVCTSATGCLEPVCSSFTSHCARFHTCRNGRCMTRSGTGWACWHPCDNYREAQHFGSHASTVEEIRASGQCSHFEGRPEEPEEPRRTSGEEKKEEEEEEEKEEEEGRPEEPEEPPRTSGEEEEEEEEEKGAGTYSVGAGNHAVHSAYPPESQTKVQPAYSTHPVPSPYPAHSTHPAQPADSTHAVQSVHAEQSVDAEQSAHAEQSVHAEQSPEAEAEAEAGAKAKAEPGKQGKGVVGLDGGLNLFAHSLPWIPSESYMDAGGQSRRRSAPPGEDGEFASNTWL